MNRIGEFTDTTEVTAGFPCHHPAWPVWCHRCRAQAHGFTITRDLGEVDGRRRAYGMTCMACLVCKVVAMPVQPEMGRGIAPSREACEIAIRRWHLGPEVTWLEPDEFQHRCETKPYR